MEPSSPSSESSVVCVLGVAVVVLGTAMGARVTAAYLFLLKCRDSIDRAAAF